MTETVDHPDHYKADDLEAWDVLDKYFPNDPLLWNAGKYLLRLGKKDKPAVEVGKLKAYLDRWLEKKGKELLTNLDKQLKAPQEFVYQEIPYKIYWNREELASSEHGRFCDFLDIDCELTGKENHLSAPEAGPYVCFPGTEGFIEAWYAFVRKYDL